MAGRAPDTLTRTDDWTHRAACRRWDPELFHSDSKANQRMAKSVCAACPVRDQCLADVMAWESVRGNVPWGVYGGLTADERRALAQRPAQPERNVGGRPHAPCGSDSAYNRHVRNGEPIDEPCRQAHREAAALFRATGSRTVAV